MLKFRRNKQDGQAEGGASSAGTAQVSRVSSPRKRLILGAIVIVLIAGAVTAYFMTREEPLYDIDPPKNISVEQSNRNKVQDLENNPPVESADKGAKTAYYDKLVYAYDTTGAYQEAIDAFNKRVAISTQGVDYYAYFSLARYYHEVGDAAGALAALDKAEALLPPSNPDEGYSREAKVDMINELRKEYQ